MIHDFETGNFLTNLNVESRSSVPIEQLDRQIGQLKTKLRRVRGHMEISYHHSHKKREGGSSSPPNKKT